MTAIPPRPPVASALPLAGGAAQVLGAVRLPAGTPAGPMLLQGQVVADGMFQSANGLRLPMGEAAKGLSQGARLSLYIPADQGQTGGQGLLLRGSVANAGGQAVDRSAMDRALMDMVGGRGTGTSTRAAPLDQLAMPASAKLPILPAGGLLALARPVEGAWPAALGLSPASPPNAQMPQGSAGANMQPLLLAPAPDGETPLPQGQVRLQITGQDAAGLSLARVMDSGTGARPITLALAIAPPLPAGSQLVASQPAPAASAQNSQLPALQAAPLDVLGNSWPGLRQLLSPAAEAVTPAAPEGSAKPVPLPGLAAAPDKLAFGLQAALQLASKGQFPAYMAERLAPQLPPTLRPLLDEITTQAQRLSFTAKDADGALWKGVTLPLTRPDSPDIQLLQAFFRPLGLAAETPQRPDDPASAQEGKRRQAADGTRFLINMSFDALGQIQFDGMARKARLDLRLRHAQPLPQAAHQAISRLYDRALAATGLSGQLALIGQTLPLPVPMDNADAESSLLI